MTNIRILALVTCLVLCCGWGCADMSLAQSKGSDLVSLGYQALVKGDLTLIQPLVMTEKRYRQLRDQIRPSSNGKSEWELNDDKIKELAREAKETLEESFSVIRDLMGQLRFNLAKAKHTAVVVKRPRNSSQNETQWINYLPDDPRSRLDISYLIESEGNLAVVKLNDVLLVGSERYLARGYRFQAYRPIDATDESVQNLIMIHHLNGCVPVVEEGP